MPAWKFLDYVTERHECPIVEWYGTLNDDEKAAFDVLVDILEETEDWDAPKPKQRKYKELWDRHRGLCELILKVDKKNLRPMGILRRQQREFVFLNGCEKHGLWTIPFGAFDTALKLKAQFDQGKGATRAHV